MDPIIAIYSFFFILLGVGILRNWKVKNPQKQTYSIIIACRNEEQNLPYLFSALHKIEYPKDKYEMIIVDDASTDGSLNLITEFCSQHDNARYFHLTSKDPVYKGKTAPLQKGADNSKFDILLFTDADCLPPSNWLESFNQYFSNEIGMVVGYSPEINASRFRYFTQLMSASFFCATIGIGLPFSNIGRNLAVKRQAFNKVGGYEKIKHHTYGEDKLLLSLINKAKYKIGYNPDVKVPTRPCNTVFKNQQRRRYGQFAISSPLYKVVSILILLFYIYLPIKVLVFNDWISFLLYFLSALFFLGASLFKHNEKFHPIDLLYLIIYPYYLIYYSIAGMYGKWQWKSL